MAQPKVARIGLLWIKEEGTAPYLDALRDALRALGYVDGRTILLDERFLVERYDELAAASGKLVAENPSAIVTFGGSASVAASKATASVPVVNVGGDPVRLGLAESLSRPGKNVTGVTFITSDLSAKRLELMRELVPGLRRVAVVFYARSEVQLNSLKAYETAARTLNIEIRRVEVPDLERIGPAILSISRKDADAIAFVGSSALTASRKTVLAAMRKNGLPAMYANRDFVEDGGLMSYATNVSEGFRRAAIYIDKILKGAKPGELPIEQPTKIDLVINLRTAKSLGLAVPRTLLVRADKVIE